MIKSKPSAARQPPPVPKKLNVFGENKDGDDSSSFLGKSTSNKLDSRQNMNIQLMAHGLQSQRQIERSIKDAEEVDPSVFAYDEVYDTMKESKERAKRKDQDDKKVSTMIF